MFVRTVSVLKANGLLWHRVEQSVLCFPITVALILVVLLLQGRLPVKWMAPEALFDRVYTHQSDV